MNAALTAIARVLISPFILIAIIVIGSLGALIEQASGNPNWNTWKSIVMDFVKLLPFYRGEQ